MRNTQRLDKILANSGFGTRKEIKDILKSGNVKLNGVVVKDGSIHINPFESNLEVFEKILEYKEYIYLMMNKPQGVISATFDNRHKTVLDLLTDYYKSFDLFPAGRLDIDTEGFVLLTNDGKLAHDMLSPKKHVKKTYYAKIHGEVTQKDVDAFNEGIILDDGYKTLPAKLEIIKSSDLSEVNIEIFEGKFHQIKRMFEALDKKVVYLKRTCFGNLLLDNNLELGHFRELSQEEIDNLKNSKTLADKEL